MLVQITTITEYPLIQLLYYAINQKEQTDITVTLNILAA